MHGRLADVVAMTAERGGERAGAGPQATPNELEPGGSQTPAPFGLKPLSAPHTVPKALVYFSLVSQVPLQSIH